ncbi:LPS export ABC transporter ATP-binding protein [Desulfurispirillum indicum]|uniref:Lipopolysaccharide export system ATP-binding protein LptB n=1 Tax=Desulfurispirillum indicum (strain ATCC BAA-1389 / DSM 22839 / S5) TaxID=653733 RepID=E6W107_DESIS|nr:ABC transporter related protein [Desulfurispirillum indicum S5]
MTVQTDTRVLEARGLVKRYGKRTVVDQVDFHVNQAEVVALLGPNGAGKTTTFYMTVGLVPADAGSIFFEGQDISPLPVYRRGHLGLAYLPQEPSVFRKLSVEDNIWALLELRRDISLSRKREILEDLLQEFHITHIRKSMGYVLSGGERRRVEIARALAQNPKMVLLDEPFAGIDPIAVEEIRTIIRQLQQRGIATLITDHNVRETLGTCDRAYILSDGRILAQGDPTTITSSPAVRQAYLGENYRG